MVMIQIRNVPPDLHERLKKRAAAKGMNLSDFLKDELERIVSIPSNAELLARMRERELLPIDSQEIVDIIRDGRNER